MSNSFGKQFRVTTFGESHGGAVGVVIDGCPAGLTIDLQQVQDALERRRPGQSSLTSPRQEADAVECLSGLSNGRTLGTPITLVVRNKDAKPADYQDMRDVLRPSHADFTTLAKYGIRSESGGGRSSARETIGRVAAGAIAEQLLCAKLPSFAICAFVDSVKHLRLDLTKLNLETLSRHDVDKDPTRCPDAKAAQEFTTLITKTKNAGDSVGGTIYCVIRGIPPGLGEPVFDKIEADLAKAMLSLPATKGFEVGDGFAATQLFGSEHNDPFLIENNSIRTASNHSGGIQGGISNGEQILFRVAFKPVATIFKEQQTLAVSDESQAKLASAAVAKSFTPKAGRHDPCVLPRAVPMVEAMALLVLADHYLRNHTSKI